MNWLHPRDEILATMERIDRSRMTTTSGGNLSIREDNGDVWITPARVDKGSLRRDDVILVRADGSIDGKHRPSSELPFHEAIYAARPDLRAIVHAHPVALVAFSICRRVPDTRLLRQSWRICGEVGFAPYELPGSPALGKNIAATFARGFDCVVLENHGVVTAGGSLQQAFERFETLEFAAKTMIKGFTWIRVNRNAERIAKKLARRKRRIENRLQAARDSRFVRMASGAPAVLSTTGLKYELAEKSQAIVYGGVPLML